ncbi:hypothetical protein MKW92_026955, partial [Papaver armeniacum]
FSLALLQLPRLAPFQILQQDKLDEWNIPARHIGGPFLVSDNEDGKLMGSFYQFNEPY